MFHKILVCVGGAEKTADMLCAAGDLSRRYGGEVVLLSVLDPADFADLPFSAVGAKPVIDHGASRNTAQMRKAGEILKGLGVTFQCRLETGRPVATILQVCEEEHPDLIVVGSRGGGRIRSWLRGSVSDEVMRAAPCPVLRVGEAAPAAQMKHPTRRPVRTEEAFPFADLRAVPSDIGCRRDLRS